MALAACSTDDGSDDGGRTTVSASFFPLAEAARQVGGDAVDVTDLTPPGVEPHDIELSADEVADVEDADVVVVLGAGFQPAVEEVADRRDGDTVVVLREAEADPHVWLDPTEMQQIVDAVAAALADADPGNASRYGEAAAQYDAELATLDAEFEAGLADCDRDLLVTAHEAFGALAERYGLRQEGVTGVSPDQEPDPRRLDELADLVEQEGVTTVFTEVLVSPAVAETLAREVGVETAVLDPLESGAPGDYVPVMRANLATLRTALGCR